MKILISNDDGIFAPGINILADTLRDLGEIYVVAPDRNRSGASNSLTLDRPLRVREIEDNFYSVIGGTPTDCVHLAITGLLEIQPDMVVSGINAGANLGDDVLYSGTVAAATEGRFLGLPAIAVSLVENNGDEKDYYKTAAFVTKHIIERIKTDRLPTRTILNVNVPNIHFEEIVGYEITRLGTRHCAEPTIRQTDPRGHTIYWVGPPGTEEDAGPGTDFNAISRKKVSISPMQLDLTHYEEFEILSEWINGLEVQNYC